MALNLPRLVDTSRWRWKSGEDRDWWIGTDKRGNRWFVKLHGGWYAFREMVAFELLRRVGLSVPSVAYAIVPETARPRKNQTDAGEYHLASELLPIHVPGPCASDCAVPALKRIVSEPDSELLVGLRESAVPGALSFAYVELVAYLLGANEPGEVVITQGHECYIVDVEQMFSTEPVSVWRTSWLKASDGRPSREGIEIAVALLARFATLTDRDITEVTTIPREFQVEQLWDVPGRVFAARLAAQMFVDEAQERPDT